MLSSSLPYWIQPVLNIWNLMWHYAHFFPLSSSDEFVIYKCIQKIACYNGDCQIMDNQH
jgi:hypothetical protein